MKRLILNTNWKFCLSEKEKTKNNIPNKLLKPGRWFPAAVPGTIHTDLLNNKLIDDPYYGDNETKLEWISEKDWVYKTEFDFNPEKKNYNLIFEGLDTIADIHLNGNKIASTQNMFLKYELGIKKFLKKGKNELKIFFHSPVNYAKNQEAKYGKLPVELNSYRAYIRKAQYSFGWDWGPSFPTSGIWRDVYIDEEASAEIESILFDTISLSKTKAKVRVTAGIKCSDNSKKKLLVGLAGESKKISITGSNTYEVELSIKEPKLWWTNGEGGQNLYELKLTLVDKKDNELNSVTKKVGIRTIELITKEKKENTFKLRLNGRDIFAKGVNWIPADSFLPCVDKSKYSKLLNYAKEANMNIVRVWGGGVYEDDYFYQLCDELGLLVWQDFMFACGAYPEQKEFINNVKEEIEQNVLRLQHHPSIALWCGNNENEWVWYQKYDTPYKEMPGYKIYHELIPGILKKLDPLKPYHPSSPFGWDEDPNSFDSGNTHQWQIWSMWVDYEQVKNDKSLFVTEFGFQGPANKDTFKKVIPKENRKVHDRVFEFHNKQVEGPERIWRFLTAHLPVTTNWDDFLYLAQLNQSFALKTCLEHWRTNGRTKGSIIWQINDSWPVTSWAIIDYDLKPKLAYHFVKNIFTPQYVYFHEFNEIIETRLQNQSAGEFTGIVKLILFNAFENKTIEEFRVKAKINANGEKTIIKISNSKIQSHDNVVLISRLYTENGDLVSTNYFNAKRWKYYKMNSAKPVVELKSSGTEKKIIISSNKAAFFVDLYAKEIEFTERGFSLLPGEFKEIAVKGNVKNLRTEDIKISVLNNYLI